MLAACCLRVLRGAGEGAQTVTWAAVPCARGQGRQWVRLVVLGQSFMMHQIRKMVATALAVYRGAAPADAIPLALSPRRRIVRPSVGLGKFLHMATP